MHLHFPFTAVQILWTLTFAAHLVLLIVLLGRDRIRRFPWFTASIVLIAFRLLTSQLLAGRLPQMTMAEIFIVLADLGAFLSLMVVIEIARKAFGRARRASWLTGAIAVMILGAAVLRFWGAWPSWQTLKSGSPLQVLQFLAQKGMLLADVETIAVGLLIVVLGRRCGAGFRSHVQQIAIGLMTASIAQLSIQAIWERIAKTAVAHSMADYTRILGMRERMFNTNNSVYLIVLVWWIVCLWIDEPGQRTIAAETGDEALLADEETLHGRELPRGPEVDEASSGEQP